MLNQPDPLLQGQKACERDDGVNHVSPDGAAGKKPQNGEQMVFPGTGNGIKTCCRCHCQPGTLRELRLDIVVQGVETDGKDGENKQDERRFA